MTESDTRTATPHAGMPVLPGIVAEVRANGTGYLTVDGVSQDLVGTDMSDVGAQITGRIAVLAGSMGKPLRAEVRDPDGLWMLIVHPDGQVEEAPPPAPVPTPVDGPTVADLMAAPPAVEPVQAETAVHGVAPALVEESDRLGELLAPRRRARQQSYANQGFRGAVRKATFDAIKPRPGKKERRHLDAVESVRRSFDGPRTIVVINPKGGAHKTTAALMLAATFGLQRGGYTLAWDNNETHGTLGWRSASKGSGGTALDLLQALPRLEAAGDVRMGDLDQFVRTQAPEQFDVLASDEDAASGAFIDAGSFATLHTLLSRFYRTIIVDTGNNIRSSNWRAAVEAADQLVIVTTIREDTAQAAAWAVDALRVAGLDDKVASAVTILSEPDRKVDKDLRARLREYFGTLTRTVVEVPFDPALVAGGPIEYADLAPDTREAWLQASAVVADEL
ncbi:MAG: chromosome partitioning protein [Micrococcales bacterium]|nr:chromosome partitioning protein [Micrococcales bacterium]